MQAKFLLGPAGSGKTYRCLAEIRAALKASPEGAPLILLAPKQATFQLERQLLADDSLPGYTRLRIFSFERLAEFIFEQLGRPVPVLLSEEGRVMVLRALLGQRQRELKLFRASARLPGLAKQLSLLLRELQRHHLSVAKLESLAAKVGSANRLDAKLHDLALILRAYLDWLRQHQLEDADRLLDLASETLRSQIANRKSQIRLAGLWLDGFAEMTPQELTLLATLVPLCEQATLAFCLEAEPRDEPSWLSPWTVIGQTFRRCHQALSSHADCQTSIEVLARESGKSRFGGSPALRHLEEHWTQPKPFAISDFRSTNDRQRVEKTNQLREKHPTSNIQYPTSNTCAGARPLGVRSRTFDVGCSLRLLVCPNPQAEAIFAAREILRHVRAGGRFREAGVLVRSLDGYADTVRRVFTRYDIPFFLDRREPVAHHPLAELTRYALRTVAFDWRQEDWFGALKTGLVPARNGEIDWLENAALEFGWEGTAWLLPLQLPANAKLSESAEGLRQKLVPPFAALAQQTTMPLDGPRLAATLREFWNKLEVERTLEQWSRATLDPVSQLGLVHRRPPRSLASDSRTTDERRGRERFDASRHSPLVPSIHATVWDQMHAWLDDLALGFAGEPMPLREWLPVLEAGLGALTVGVIPPALDQVLIGAVDRSRNPDLKLALVLGVNEGIFPAPPALDPLLTEVEREALAAHGADLGPTPRQWLGHERYLGYIACTRVRERLVLTCAEFDSRGKKLNRSLFFDQLKRLFPDLEIEAWQPPTGFKNAEHLSEIIPLAIQLKASLLTGKRGVSTTTQHMRQIPSPPSKRGPEGRGAHEVTRPTDLLSENASALLALPQLAPVLAKARQVLDAAARERLSSAVAERLYGRELLTSVSALEDYAACPFKFFVARGLQARERERFEVDRREKGSFQHEALKEFHRRLQAQGWRWRDIAPDAAREQIARIGEELIPTFRNGVFQARDAGFTARILIRGLQNLVETLVGWAGQYEFDPHAVEISFGLDPPDLPPWRLDLGDGHGLRLRGRIDRVDICPIGNSGEALATIIDYKSSAQELDRIKLHHGLELQLLAYLGVLRHLADARDQFEVWRLRPAGAFYVNLRGEFKTGATRARVLAEREQARQRGYQHRGRFDGNQLVKFDNTSARKGVQFRFSQNKDGTWSKRGNEALPAAQFTELLDTIEDFLRGYGREIYAGNAVVAPYRSKSETACQRCEFLSVCRFDEWTENYRVLRLPADAKPLAKAK